MGSGKQGNGRGERDGTCETDNGRWDDEREHGRWMIGNYASEQVHGNFPALKPSNNFEQNNNNKYNLE
ncbi:hypothetical protein GCM10007422_04220 [Pedobacter zeae]|uniref:Uncharacterized protein n=1 Tax=Pedobacter zeae TaxID=1737356 RepID=A0ABQ1XHZ0_9SPHI|nr:hypothetical protein GCM10007422_04220 [Pedobacter zeae]